MKNKSAPLRNVLKEIPERHRQNALHTAKNPVDKRLCGRGISYRGSDKNERGEMYGNG